MRAIIIGAGRGKRLMPLTEGVPKCYAEVGGRRILEWGLAALRASGVDDIVFIGGYQIDRILADYPTLSFRHNVRWEQNNILASLFYAEDAMDAGFISTYADILYRPELITALLAAPGEIVLGVDTGWRRRYLSRLAHPESDAEKVVVADGRVTRIGRDIPSETTHGEFVGLAKFSPNGAAALRELYHARRAAAADGPYRSAASFERAYLIEMLQDMIEQGTEMQSVDTDGGYFEIDTTEDFHLAQAAWR